MTNAANSARSRFAQSFECPACGVHSVQDWRMVGHMVASQGTGWMEPQNYHVLSEEVYDPFAGEFDDETPPFDDPKADWVVGSMWASAQCQRCRKASIWRDNVMVYPGGKGGPAPHPDMAASATTLYEEARAVVPISRRAGAAMARATLELVLRELDPEVGEKATLNARIEHIRPRVSSGLMEMLDVIRYAGNESVHVGDSTDDVIVLVLDERNTELIDFLFESINDLVDELHTKPSRQRGLAQSLPESVRTGIEQRRVAAERKRAQTGEPTT